MFKFRGQKKKHPLYPFGLGEKTIVVFLRRKDVRLDGKLLTDGNFEKGPYAI